MFMKIIGLLIRRKSFKRQFSQSCSQNREVRVRFAPSPTGYLHLGGLRTALYNYLFAKSKNGKFILRIEDTDQSRLVPEAVVNLDNDLQWAGIYPDESPSTGGLFGPYKQSERLHLYSEQVEIILKSGSAYHCFCSDQRLDLLRREALRARQVPRYDNRCRHLSQSEVQEKLERGEHHCIRFKLEPNSEPYPDLVYGLIHYDVAQNESDPVIIKSDGFPTYHFANVVDDHFMNISHVLRGVEWQVSTPKHILLYRAFGWEPPQFAHLPLILNPDGSKLSKRQGDIRLEHYRNNGIFPTALLNFVTNTGGGFSKDAEQSKPRIYSLQDLANQFDLSRVNPNSCRLMPERLDEFNGLELKRKLQDKSQIQKLVEEVKKLVLQSFQNRLENRSLQLQDDHVKSVLIWGQERIKKLSDLVDTNFAFLWVVPSSLSLEDTNLPGSHIEILKNLKLCLLKKTEPDFHHQELKMLLKEFARQNELPFNKLMKLLRHVLSGLQEGPGVAEMMAVLGRPSTLSRLERAITMLKSQLS